MRLMGAKILKKIIIMHFFGFIYMFFTDYLYICP
jgi:hypothetical protein